MNDGLRWRRDWWFLPWLFLLIKMLLTSGRGWRLVGYLLDAGNAFLRFLHCHRIPANVRWVWKIFGKDAVLWKKKRAWFSTCDHFCYLRDLPYLEDFWPRDKLLENEEWNVVDFFRREKSFTSCVSPVSLLDLSEKHEPENKIHIKQPHTSCTPNKCRLAHKFWAASKKKTQRKTNHPQ